MLTKRSLSLTTLALVSGVSLLSPAGAQQHQQPSSGGEIQLYSLPTGPAGKPAMPAKSAESSAEIPAVPAESPAMPAETSRPAPYPDPEPGPSAQSPTRTTQRAPIGRRPADRSRLRIIGEFATSRAESAKASAPN